MTQHYTRSTVYVYSQNPPTAMDGSGYRTYVMVDTQTGALHKGFLSFHAPEAAFKDSAVEVNRRNLVIIGGVSNGDVAGWGFDMPLSPTQLYSDICGQIKGRPVIEAVRVHHAVQKHYGKSLSELAIPAKPPAPLPAPAP